MTWLVSPARPSDFETIHRVVAAAFGREAEADLVEALRVSGAWLPGLALVARQPENLVRPTHADRPIVGFAALTRMTVGGRPALALAPVAVAPGWQGQGAGSALVRHAIARAIEGGERLIVVLGSPRYYGRFGFEAARPMGIDGPYDEAGAAFRALALPGTGEVPSGLAVYPDEFAGF